MKTLLTGSIKTLIVAAMFGCMAMGSANAQTVYDDAKLESFIDATIVLEKLLVQWNFSIDRLRGDRSIGKMRMADEMAVQRDVALQVALEKLGLIGEEYDEIKQAAKNDPELDARIQKIFVEKTSY